MCKWNCELSRWVFDEVKGEYKNLLQLSLIADHEEHHPRSEIHALDCLKTIPVSISTSKRLEENKDFEGIPRTKREKLYVLYFQTYGIAQKNEKPWIIRHFSWEGILVLNFSFLVAESFSFSYKVWFMLIQNATWNGHTCTRSLTSMHVISLPPLLKLKSGF